MTFQFHCPPPKDPKAGFLPNCSNAVKKVLLFGEGIVPFLHVVQHVLQQGARLKYQHCYHFHFLTLVVHKNYPEARGLVSCIHEIFINYVFTINISTIARQTATARVLTEGKGRSGNIDVLKVKMHLAGEFHDNNDSRNSFDKEFNEKSTMKLQFFLFFNMFNDDQSDCSVLQKLQSQKSILCHGITEKEAEILIYVVKEIEDKEEIGKNHAIF